MRLGFFFGMSLAWSGALLGPASCRLPVGSTGPDGQSDAGSHDGVVVVDGRRTPESTPKGPKQDASVDASIDGLPPHVDAAPDASAVGDASPENTYTVTSGSPYFINGVPQPPLALKRGVTYAFIAKNGPGHPMILVAPPTDTGGHEVVDPNQLTSAELPGYAPGGACTASCATTHLLFTPNGSTPDQLNYVCAFHAGEGATITISN
jgi:hypothetical protein